MKTTKTRRYRIIRHFERHDTVTVKTNLTMDEAIAHCRDPETSWRTATSSFATIRTEMFGPWFDGWTEMTLNPEGATP